MTLSTESRLTKLFQFALTNFGPLIAFYSLNHFIGLKVAIAGACLVTLGEAIRFKLRKETPTPFFKFSAVMALCFGVLDLIMVHPFFFKFEASIANLFFAGFFGLSLMREKPLIQEFAEQQGRVDGVTTPDHTFFFRFLTLLWIVYFVGKAVVYLWVYFNHSVEQGLILRALIGNVSLAVMLFISIGLSRPIWAVLLRLRLMPSTRRQRH